MEPSDLLAFAAAAFERMDVEYAVVGSMASSFYGYGRSTTDVDIVADLRPSNLGELLAAFPENDFYLDGETTRIAIVKRNQFKETWDAVRDKIDPPRP